MLEKSNPIIENRVQKKYEQEEQYRSVIPEMPELTIEHVRMLVRLWERI